ncbi:hypothetical protein D3C80_834360 [compost metagenome]
MLQRQRGDVQPAQFNRFEGGKRRLKCQNARMFEQVIAALFIGRAIHRNKISAPPAQRK